MRFTACGTWKSSGESAEVEIQAESKQDALDKAAAMGLEVEMVTRRDGVLPGDNGRVGPAQPAAEAQA